MKFKTKNIWSLLSVLVVIGLMTTACGTSSSSVADITFVIGDGTQDQKIHNIVYPGQNYDYEFEDYRTTKVAPGNYRNYIINDGTRKNLDGSTVGDSPDLLDAVLPSDTKIEVGLTVLWMLNQNAVKVGDDYQGPLVEFYKFAAKYNALNQTNDPTGNVNASTPGWNLMLSENFYSALQSALYQALENIQNDWDSVRDEPMVFETKITDEIWKTGDTRQKEVLAAEISRLFQSEIAKMTGSNEKMFCGSGAQSGWTNPDPSQAGKPGNKFECADVRIKIDSVIYKADQGSETGSQTLIDANKAEYEAAYEKYHEQTDCWLGILDAIDACGEAGRTCNIYLDPSVCTVPSGEDVSNFLKFPNAPTALPEAGAGTSATPEATPAP